MGFFKKNVDVVDLADMRRRGLLKENSGGSRISESSGITDFTSSVSSSNNTDTVNLDFLGNLAGASVNSESPGRITDSLRTARLRNRENSEIHELKIRLDDNNFKLNSAIERIRELERRLNERGI
ncbi:MAG: hypothetical protein Q8P57_03725 [Candidatus Pacearchaeota archaeon]|nr:hypothetical protein [Candidatus Pacearchaeota archaeon]